MITHHNLTFRQEFFAQMWQCVHNRDSCAVLAVSGMGKSRVLDFAFRPDVRQHYLGAEATRLRLIRADGNRANEISEWALYELILTGILEDLVNVDLPDTLRQHLFDQRRDVVLNPNALLAQRTLETALHELCSKYALRFTVVLDEFDDFYKQLNNSALANLRALRDLLKPFNYGVSYVLMMRDTPARLRDPDECEGFYELFSRYVFGLRPCNNTDARAILQHSQARRSVQLPEDTCEAIIQLSGGHPSLIDALTVDAIKGADTKLGTLSTNAREECRKIWDGLANDEHAVLIHSLNSPLDYTPDSAYTALSLKGILKADRSLFSQLFEAYIAQFSTVEKPQLTLDKKKYCVYLGPRVITKFSQKEFKLLNFLYQHANQVVNRDDVLKTIYPDDILGDGEDNRLDAFIKRLRSKLEPIPSKPEYLITLPSIGYKLVTAP